MKKKLACLAMIAPVVATLLVLALPAPSDAQLMVVTRRYRVVAVDADRNVIKVSPADKEESSSSSDVVVSPSTRMYVFDREIPSFSWKLLRQGMKITVEGGLTWDMRVKAKKIYL